MTGQRISLNAYLSVFHLCPRNLYEKSHFNLQAVSRTALIFYLYKTSARGDLPWACIHSCTLCKLLDTQEYVGAFQNPYGWLKSTGFLLKSWPDSAQTEITALSSGYVANSCCCFSKALGVGFFFPQLSQALSQIK